MGGILVAIEASVDDICGEAERDIHAGPHNSILYNQQNGMPPQTHGIITFVVFLHFCIELHC